MIYRHFKKRTRCLLVCHDAKEVRWARQIDPQGEVFVSNDAREYLNVYSRAAGGIVNRLHAAMALFSFGKPTVAVASDSRALMVEAVGIPHYHVNHVTGAELIERMEALLHLPGDVAAASETARENAMLEYQRVLECL